MKNVLFISIDDMMNIVRYRDAYGVPFHTPNIDRLLEAGTFFNSAHALCPECGPSRASVMTGQSVFRTKVEQNGQDVFDYVAPAATLPAVFREAGYETASVGKVFHGIVQPHELDSALGRHMQALFDVFQPTEGELYGGDEGDILQSLRPSRLPETQLADRRSADWASGYIEDHPTDQPWFLAVGFSRPHLAWQPPRKYFDLYDLADIEVPATDHAAVEALSPFVRQFFRTHLHREIVAADAWQEAIRAYMASVSYVDAQVGRVLRAMDQADAWSNTTVMLWSDHGFHLGDQETWGKFTHWENGTNAPLVIVDPDVGTPGTVVNTPVSLLDILPTLTDLTGISDTIARDGHSLVPLMRDPDAAWDHFAGSFLNGSFSLRTGRFRYVASADGSEQLYDMRHDPGQRVNLAADPDHRADLRWMRMRLAEDAQELGGRFSMHADTVRGTAGEDGFLITPNLEQAIGGAGDDLYAAIDPSAIVEEAGGGFDTLRLFAPSAAARIDVKVPWAVDLTILDRSAGGSVAGTEAADRIQGDRLAVRLDGAGGNDELVGSGGDDRLLGGAGNDGLSGRYGADTLVGGRGRDDLRGAQHRDALSAGYGNDRLDGGSGDDRLFGERGNDRLFGGEGRDRLSGGSGRDVATGGSGNDTFVFAAQDGSDVILDFAPGKDRIDLTALGLDGLRSIDRDLSVDGWAIARIPDAHVTIRLEQVAWSDLDAADFLF